MTNAVRTFGVVGLAAVFLIGAIQVQGARERAYPTPDVEEDAVYITSGSAIRRLSSAYNALAADVYWIRAVQHYGGTKRRLSGPRGPEPPPMLAAVETDDYDQLYTLLDIATTLDPLFDIAYRFGAVFLAEAYPVGAGRVDLAVKLLEKGLAARPDKWEYAEDIGFVYYWYAHDYRQAAAWFDKGGDIPGAPAWLKPLGATTLAQGGDRQSSRAMWERIRQSSDLEWVTKAAEHRLVQLRAMDQIEALQAAVDAYALRAGESPSSWPALVRAGAVRGIPVDPTGEPYSLAPGGRVRLSQSSTLFPLPEEPQRLQPQ